MILPMANRGAFAPASSALFGPNRCRDLIVAAESCDGWSDAGIYGSAGADQVDTDERSAASLPAESFDFPVDELVRALVDLNDRHFRYRLAGLPSDDRPSLLRYSADVADHFREHRDVGEWAATRKLTYVVQLSDPDSYEGGDLVFSALGRVAPRTQGTLIAFPAFETHHVTPVLRGTRHAVVGWVHGDTLS